MTSSLAVPGGSFDDMYQRELPAIIALTVALTGNREAGVDLAQEAMTRAFRAWSKVGEYERPGAWVRRMAINLAVDARRRQQREAAGLRRLPRHEAIADAEPTTAAFWDAVRALPARQRAAICLHHLDDMAITTSPPSSTSPRGTIKAALFQARRTLATHLGLPVEEDR